MKKYKSVLIFTCNIFCIILFAAGLIFFAANPLAEYLAVSGSSVTDNKKPVVVIDPGHGGKDPGKVSEDGLLEKDVNLNIALKLRDLLTAQDVEVILTRDTDKELVNVESNRKMSDLKARIDLIAEHSPDVVVGIHQNSYPEPSVYGAQCFYLSDHEDSRNLASILHDQIVKTTNQTKIREIKGNESYYILKESPATTAIVECGFLSNPEETALLATPEYQDKMAWAIHLGILQYLNS